MDLMCNDSTTKCGLRSIETKKDACKKMKTNFYLNCRTSMKKIALCTFVFVDGTSRRIHSLTHRIYRILKQSHEEIVSVLIVYENRTLKQMMDSRLILYQ